MRFSVFIYNMGRKILQMTKWDTVCTWNTCLCAWHMAHVPLVVIKVQSWSAFLILKRTVNGGIYLPHALHVGGGWCVLRKGKSCYSGLIWELFPCLPVGPVGIETTVTLLSLVTLSEFPWSNLSTGAALLPTHLQVSTTGWVQALEDWPGRLTKSLWCAQLVQLLPLPLVIGVTQAEVDINSL
jgi:hypothetical protein